MNVASIVLWGLVATVLLATVLASCQGARADTHERALHPRHDRHAGPRPCHGVGNTHAHAQRVAVLVSLRAAVPSAASHRLVAWRADGTCPGTLRPGGCHDAYSGCSSAYGQRVRWPLAESPAAATGVHGAQLWPTNPHRYAAGTCVVRRDSRYVLLAPAVGEPSARARNVPQLDRVQTGVS